MSRLSRRRSGRKSYRGILMERIMRSGRCHIIDHTGQGYVTDFELDPDDVLFTCSHRVLDKHMRPHFCSILGVFEACDSCVYFDGGVTYCSPRVMTASQVADHII